MRASGSGTSATAGGTSTAAGGGPYARSGGNDNSNFNSMIEGIFTSKSKPYLLEPFMYFLEGNTKSKR